MSSALGGVIAKLLRGERLSSEAIREIERTLDALRAEGWSGYVPADQAVRWLAEPEEDDE